MTERSGDRTVHGRSVADAWEVVRYDRAGKWYIEHTDGRRVRVTVQHAATVAAAGAFFPRLPGGRVFDQMVRARPARTHSEVRTSPADVSASAQGGLEQ